MTFKDPKLQREYYRRYDLAHPEQRRRIHHRSEWKSYGLDVDECELVYYSTKKCDVCGTIFEGKIQRSLDHDHSTKRIRGVLCANCNLAVGLLNDDPALLAKSVKYMEGN